MYESIEIIRDRLASDAEALALLEDIERKLSAADDLEKEQLRMESELQEAGQAAALALHEAAEARLELESLAVEAEALKCELAQARLCGLLAVEAARAGCERPFDLIKLAGCEGAVFDEQGELRGAPEWLKRVRGERPYMFESRRSVQPPLYRAGQSAEEEGINGVLAGAARCYDGQ